MTGPIHKIDTFKLTSLLIVAPLLAAACSSDSSVDDKANDSGLNLDAKVDAGQVDASSTGTLLYHQGFEVEGGWQGDFTGLSTWEDHVARVSHEPHSGNFCLRGNQMEGLLDPITGLIGKGNNLLDWRGAGYDIAALTPNEAYFSYWFRHDDYDYDDSISGEGKLFYFVDEQHSVRAMYIGYQLCKSSISVRYSNGDYPDAWADTNWGYSSMYLSSQNVPPSCDGIWRHFEYYINYNDHFFQIWIDGQILLPGTGSNSEYWDQYPNEAASGIILYDQNLDIHWKGFQLFYASTGDLRNFDGCVNQTGYCVGWQIDDLEIWDGMP